MAFDFNEEKQVYIVNGVEIPKAAYEAVHLVLGRGVE